MARDIEGESDYYKSHGGIIPVKWTAPEVVALSQHCGCACVYRNYWRLLEITGEYWRLLEITGDYWRLLEVTGDY